MTMTTATAPPPCDECGEPSVAVVNGLGMCADTAHIDAVIAKVFAPIHELRRNIQMAAQTPLTGDIT